MSTPKSAMQQFCRECVSGDIRHVKDCQGNTIACPLFPVRMREGKLSVRIIRSACLYCMGENRDLVFICPTEDCSLYPYRLGKNPNCINNIPPVRQNGNNLADGGT